MKTNQDPGIDDLFQSHLANLSNCFQFFFDSSFHWLLAYGCNNPQLRMQHYFVGILELLQLCNIGFFGSLNSMQKLEKSAMDQCFEPYLFAERFREYFDNRVFRIAMAIFSCRREGDPPEFYGLLVCRQLLQTDCLSFVRVQDGPSRGVLPCLLHELAVERWLETTCCPLMVICPIRLDFLVCSFLQDSQFGQEEWCRIVCKGVEWSLLVASSW